MQPQADGSFSYLLNSKKSQMVGVEINQIHLKLVKVSEVITQFQIELYQFEDERFRVKKSPNRILASECFTVLCYCVMNFGPT